MRVSSLALSDTSPRRITSGRHIDLESIPWKALEATEWMVEFRKSVKIRSYALIYEVRRAMLVFEEARKTHYAHYHNLESACNEIWEAWRVFAGTKEVDAPAIQASPVFVDMGRIPAAMVTPRGTNKRELMGEIRVATRAAIRDIDELKDMVKEVLQRLQENEADGDENEEPEHVSVLPDIRPLLEAPTPLEALSIRPEQAKWEVCSHPK